jgi:hypothetical protein
VRDIGSTAPQHGRPGPFRVDGDPVVVRDPPDLTHAAAELLAIVAYVTGDDGPLRTSSDSVVRLSPLHRRLVGKAMERLDVIDAFLRSRVAFFVAGRGHGYFVPAKELDLAGAALDTCRATTSVVVVLLAGRVPDEREFESMSRTALSIYPALEASDE